MQKKSQQNSCEPGQQDAEKSPIDLSGDMIDAVANYADAYGQSVRSKFDVATSELKLGLVRLIAALAGAVVAVIMFLSAWILAMVGLAAALADTLTYPGANVLLLAALNLVFGFAFYFWATATWRKAWSVRPASAFKASAFKT